MAGFKIGDKVEWFSGDNIISTGEITGVKFASSLGNIYKVTVPINEKYGSKLNPQKITGSTTKHIHQNNLRLKK